MGIQSDKVRALGRARGRRDHATTGEKCAKSARKHAKTRENTRKRAKTCENVRKRAKTCENTRKVRENTRKMRGATEDAIDRGKSRECEGMNR